MEWFRWYGGTFNDPKLQWVANKSCHTVAETLAVWVAVLERAHGNETRGCCAGMDFESLDISLGMEDGSTNDIFLTMQRKGMIIANDMVAAWEKRQPKREDDGAAERQKNKREKDKLINKIEELQKQLEASLSRTVTDVTQCHAMSQQVTTEERREEEKREEEPLKPLLQQQADAGDQIRLVVVEKRIDLERLFPVIDLDVALEKLMNRCRGKPCLLDPYDRVLKWLQSEFKPVKGETNGTSGGARASVRKTSGIVPPNSPDADWLGGSQFA
jgi:hypothetical protein